MLDYGYRTQALAMAAGSDVLERASDNLLKLGTVWTWLRRTCDAMSRMMRKYVSEALGRDSEVALFRRIQAFKAEKDSSTH
jgi:hypothetical protein